MSGIGEFVRGVMEEGVELLGGGEQRAEGRGPSSRSGGTTSDWLERRQQEAFDRIVQNQSSNNEPDRPIEIMPPDPLGGAGGVHPDWRVDPTTLDPSDWPTDQDGNLLPQSAVQQSMTPSIPYYTEGDILVPLHDNWSTSRITEVQDQLERAGLLQPNQYRRGSWGPESIAAFEQVLTQSNATATPWDETVQQLIANPLPGPEMPQRGTRHTPTYMRPNPENVGEGVRNLITQLVGRDYATDERVAKFTQLFMQDHRTAWEQEEEIKQQVFEQEQTQTILDTMQGDPRYGDVERIAVSPAGVDDQPPEEAEIPDPEQTLNREVREDLEGIMSAQDEQDRAQQANRTLTGVFGSMTRWGGGQ